MRKIHIISDNNYFLLGVSGIFHSTKFSNFKTTRVGSKVSCTLMRSIRDGDDDVTVINVVCRKVRRALLIVLGRLGKKFLLMARFTKSQENPLPPYLMMCSVTAAELLDKVAALIKIEIYSMCPSLINSPAAYVISLLEKGHSVSGVSSFIKRNGKVVCSLKNLLIERFGLRAGRGVNLLLCSDLLGMFSAHSKACGKAS